MRFQICDYSLASLQRCLDPITSLQLYFLLYLLNNILMTLTLESADFALIYPDLLVRSSRVVMHKIIN